MRSPSPCPARTPGNMRSRAVLSDDGRHYVLNGRKSWITSGPVADTMVVFLMTDPEKASPRHHRLYYRDRPAGF